MEPKNEQTKPVLTITIPDGNSPCDPSDHNFALYDPDRTQYHIPDAFAYCTKCGALLGFVKIVT